MKRFSLVMRVFLILALMLNGIMAAQAAVLHALPEPAQSMESMHCHEDAEAAKPKPGKAHLAECCKAGVCACACISPGMAASSGSMGLLSPVVKALRLPPSLYISQIPPQPLRPPTA